jgi:hypothetical protein
MEASASQWICRKDSDGGKDPLCRQLSTVMLVHHRLSIYSSEKIIVWWASFHLS